MHWQEQLHSSWIWDWNSSPSVEKALLWNSILKAHTFEDVASCYLLKSHFSLGVTSSQGGILWNINEAAMGIKRPWDDWNPKHFSPLSKPHRQSSLWWWTAHSLIKHLLFPQEKSSWMHSIININQTPNGKQKPSHFPVFFSINLLSYSTITRGEWIKPIRNCWKTKKVGGGKATFWSGSVSRGKK